MIMDDKIAEAKDKYGEYNSFDRHCYCAPDALSRSTMEYVPYQQISP